MSMSEDVHQHPYTFEDAAQDAQAMGIPSQMTGMGIRFDMHYERAVEVDSVRISDPEEARGYLDEVLHKREALEQRINEEVAHMDVLFKSLEQKEETYRQKFGVIPSLEERRKRHF